VRTWLFTVLINIAKRRGIRERREAQEPSPFPATPEGSVLGSELISVAQEALEGLPERQRVVVTLQDMLGFDWAEVCELARRQRRQPAGAAAPGQGRGAQFRATVHTLGRIRDDDIEPDFRDRLINAFKNWR
jgi:hypothetical protein